MTSFDTPAAAVTGQPSASSNRLLLVVYTAAIFVSALLLFSGAVAIVIDASPGLMRLTSLSARPIVASPGSN